MKEVADWARDQGLSEPAIAELLAIVEGSSERTWSEVDGEDTIREVSSFGPRYEDRGALGTGSTAEVRRVFDRMLGRDVAMKVVRADRIEGGTVVDRFLGEARVSARLQHAGIPPIYDYGALPDGRPYITMREVSGATLRSLVDALHEAEAVAWAAGLRRAVEIVARACETVAYAHDRGMCHLDIKPHNVMIGDRGEVLVVDWGLARATDEPERAVIAGTPAYMPPEQARGRLPDPRRADVYALGATLYHVLKGAPPYGRSDAATVLARVRAGPPEPLPVDSLGSGDGRGAERAVPSELAVFVERAMSRDLDGRYAHAGELAEALGSWLAGQGRRDRARQTVIEAMSHLPAAADLRVRAQAVRAEATAELAQIPVWAPDTDKEAVWNALDEADNLDRQADAEQTFAERVLRAALQLHSDLPEAHAALAERAREDHARAEQMHDAMGARRAESALSDHVSYLPYESAERAAAVAYLRGHGQMRLQTSIPGVAVRWHKVDVVRRRLVPGEPRDLGVTPLDVHLPLGRHLLVFDGPAGPVRYPLVVGRSRPWSFTPPGADEPLPIYFPEPGDLGPDDCYVPAGWCDVGDTTVPESLPISHVWVDGFVMGRFPVTNRQYIEFLDDLVARKEPFEAFVPRERGKPGSPGRAVFGLRDGRFEALVDNEGDVYDLDWPVMMVDRPSAVAYAAWFAARTGRPWRLPAELEWEKSARGPDGRRYPWGDFFDASWCSTHEAHRERGLPSRVLEYPTDESPYGVRGLGGNSRDWCADDFRRDGPRIIGGRIQPHRSEPGANGVARGGSWTGFSQFARAAMRVPLDPNYRLPNLGFRLARPI